MAFSIQQHVAKINSRISGMDAVSLAISALIVLIFALFLVSRQEGQVRGAAYYENEDETIEGEDLRPFASRNGPTYTYAWCQGADQIKKENIVYFANAEEAERSGRTLSKLCQR